jgi:hypothetical protein
MLNAESPAPGLSVTCLTNAGCVSPADQAKLNALCHRIKTREATIGDLEAAIDLLRKYGFTQVSSKLFRLADLVRERNG